MEDIMNDFFFDSYEPISESACQIKGAVKTAFNLAKFNPPPPQKKKKNWQRYLQIHV